MIKVDTREFSRAAAQLLEKSSRSSVDFLNGQALAVSLRAIKLTDKADRGKVATALGQVATKFNYSKKTGKLRKSNVYGKDTVAHRIINARLLKRGEKPLAGPELDKAARKLIAARLRAVAFIRSGWLYAVRTLMTVVKGKRPLVSQGDSARMKGQAKGWAKPERQSLTSSLRPLVVEIGNSALLTMSQSGTHSNPMPLAQRGLQAALDASSRDMMEELARRLQPIANQHAAR